MSRTAWIVAHGALLLLGVNLLDIVLRKRYADSPEVVAGWLVGGFVLVVVLARLSRNATDGPSTPVRRFWASLDPPTLTLLAFFLVLLFLFHGSYLRAGSDGREYYVQVRSLVMDWDLDFRNDNAAFGGRGTAARYAFGAALLWAPFFLLAHAWLGLLNLFGMDLVRDGYGNPYQMAVGLGTLVYGCAALLLIRNVLRDYFSDALAVVTTVALCAGVPHPVPWTHICAMPPGVAHTPRAPRSAFDTQASRDARSGCTAPRSRPRRRGRPRGSERFGRGSLAP